MHVGINIQLEPTGACLILNVDLLRAGFRHVAGRCGWRIKIAISGHRSVTDDTGIRDILEILQTKANQ